MRESDIERSVKDYAINLGVLQFKFSSPSHRGVPDRIFLYEKECFFIEFKAYKKKLTKLQEKTKQRIEAQGIPVYVVDSVKVGKDIVMKHYLKGLEHREREDARLEERLAADDDDVDEYRDMNDVGLPLQSNLVLKDFFMELATKHRMLAMEVYSRSAKGVPSHIVLYKGEVFFIEFRQYIGAKWRLLKRTQKKIRYQDFHIAKVDTYAELKNLILSYTPYEFEGQSC